MTGTHYTPRDMLARLVAFDTTSRDGNIPLIDFVEAYLAVVENPLISSKLTPCMKV